MYNSRGRVRPFYLFYVTMYVRDLFPVYEYLLGIYVIS